jgi:phosphohistidine phosphatase
MVVPPAQRQLWIVMLSLALLRHAKSSWNAADLDDFDRPLNERGREAAPAMGAVLKELKFSPDLILCSPAQRTRQTLELVGGFIDKAETRFQHELYLPNQQTLFEQIRAVPFDTRRVLLVGHNPSIHALALYLTGTGDAKSISRLEDKFPTAALAILSFEQDYWRDIGAGTGRLEAFVVPRDRIEPKD